jgi:regulator of protease activity HflC (stomatin/prohibitin superfamily)
LRAIVELSAQPRRHILDQFFGALSPWLALGVFLVLLLVTGIKIVPQNEALGVERFGKYRATLGAGPNFIIPIIDPVAYKRTLRRREVALDPTAGVAEVPAVEALEVTAVGVGRFIVIPRQQGRITDRAGD